MHPRSIRVPVVAALTLALLLPIAAPARESGTRMATRDAAKRLLFATDMRGNLLRFRATAPEAVRTKPITGLPSGVILKGIDFRPATGDLYALGSDKTVYRVHPVTAIAVAEGPAFEVTPTALVGDRIGFDFNPTVDKIRVTSDADDNLRLDPDPGSLLASDTRLTPSEVTVVGSAYTNSSFAAFASRPATTALYAVDVGASPDRLWLQQPANAGTLLSPKSLGTELGRDVGFDIAGASNVGYLAGSSYRRGAQLYEVDIATGEVHRLGRIGHGKVTVTGLAAWQNG
jgi:Domain of unknown function (DUF4394)